MIKLSREQLKIRDTDLNWVMYLEYITEKCNDSGCDVFRDILEEEKCHAAFAVGYGLGEGWITLDDI